MADRSPQSMRRFIDSLLEDTKVRAIRTFPVDVSDCGDRLVLTVSLPGVNRDTLQIRYEQSVLTIHATLQTTPPPGATALLRERFNGELRRSLRLPMPIDFAQAEIRYEDGVLSLTLPKLAATGPYRIHLN